MTEELMFKLITKAVKELQNKSNISEDDATEIVLNGVRAMPVESCMDIYLFRLMLNSVIELELN
jgi:hypothetical protein